MPLTSSHWQVTSDCEERKHKTAESKPPESSRAKITPDYSCDQEQASLPHNLETVIRVGLLTTGEEVFIRH